MSGDSDGPRAGARFLLIGHDPASIPGAKAVADALERARRQALSEGVDLVECMIPPDRAAGLRLIRDALVRGEYRAVVIGAGIRKPEAELEFFETISNLVRLGAPSTAIGFNTSPADSVDAGFRAVNGMWVAHEAGNQNREP